MLDTVLDPLSSEVFITDELLKRPTKAADFEREKRAIQDLASQMIDAPDKVLPRFVELAMELADGSSAGLSLLEEHPAPGVFRWTHLCGSLAPFENEITPRDYSPCGVTLDLAAPVLTRHSERAYSWISATNVILPEVLLVPLFVGGKEPLGTLWIVSDEKEHFTSEHARLASELATFVGIALHVQRTEVRLRHALEAQEILTREMSHRVKNLFALTDVMIRQTSKSSATKEDFAEALSGRVMTLASAHSLVLRSEPATSETIDLNTLIEAVVKPHDQASLLGGTQFAINGPALNCNEKNASAIALVFNELATNAVKYGALESSVGRVRIRWSLTGSSVFFEWIEEGGPTVTPPSQFGFGNKLVDLTVVRQFGGALKYDWQPKGLIVTLSIPVSAFKMSPDMKKF